MTKEMDEISMVSVNYSNPQEPDEALMAALDTSNFAEGVGLAADSGMLQFTGLAAFTKYAVLAQAALPINFNRVMLYAKVQLDSDVNADDFAMIGVFFPSLMRTIGIANVGSDSTNKLSYMSHQGNAGNLIVNLDSQVEYSTTEGLLRLQIEVIRSVNAKTLPTTRFNMRASWDGVLQHEDVPLVIGRGMITLPPLLVLGVRGAASYVWIRNATLVADSLMGGRGPLETF
jgi:hypothetical protein